MTTNNKINKKIDIHDIKKVTTEKKKLKLTHQICDLGYEIEITLKKKSKKNNKANS